MSDNVLSQHVEQALSLSDKLPINLTVKTVANKSNQFYSSSGLILLTASEELLNIPQTVTTQLVRQDYMIESQEFDNFTLHMTIRLGIPLKGDMLRKAEQQFQSRTITFSHWLLLRLVTEDGKRSMHEAWPL